MHQTRFHIHIFCLHFIYIYSNFEENAEGTIVNKEFKVELLNLIHVEVLRVVMVCSVAIGYFKRFGRPSPHDGDSKVLKNVDILPQYYMVSQPRRPQLESSPS
jgi:hypothetical protein